MREELREQLAEYAHDAWSGWMRYLFEKATENDDGTVTIPAWAVERWKRQITTPYADLPENEKESDRLEADKILAIPRLMLTLPRVSRKAISWHDEGVQGAIADAIERGKKKLKRYDPFGPVTEGETTKIRYCPGCAKLLPQPQKCQNVNGRMCVELTCYDCEDTFFMAMDYEELVKQWRTGRMVENRCDRRLSK